MKVLISAYACEPGVGSEGGVGWNVVRELSQRHELVVLTRANHAVKIRASGEKWTSEVEWVFYDPPRWLTFWKRGPRGVQLFYVIWQLGAWLRGRVLMEKHQFDVAHHLTFGKYWVPSPLAWLGVPFVFGPVGGGESTPEPLREVFGWRGKMAERARDFIRMALGFPSPLRKTLRSAAQTLATTEQTAAVLREIGVPEVSVLPQSGIRPDELERFGATESPTDRAAGGAVRLVTACRLIHWKAVDFAIEAVALARKAGVDARLTVLQDGPERANLERLTRDLGLEEFVDFPGRLPTLEYVFQLIRGSDALVHPALHEAFGQACLESLALGTPVICLDWGGPGMIVTEDCGFKVTPGNKRETIARLADAIKVLAATPEKTAERRARARHRAGDFLWSRITGGIEEAYRKAAAGK